ncbi:MAG: acyl--CoA ligase [Lachnospiraceae bacterium]|nr:acyl--CoA ligase [Lachnospiraceae bacterium]
MADRRYSTFEEMLTDLNERCPDNTAILSAEYEEQVKITYHELYLRVMELANRYRREDCTCVGLYANASARWIITMLAAVIAGKRTVLIDVLFPPEQMIELVKHCGIDSLYAADREGRRAFGDYINERRAAQLDEQAEEGVAGVYPENREIEDGGKLLFFTSGTTAWYKAVVLTQEALLRDAWGGQQTAHGTSDDLVLSMLPLWHVFGFVSGILWPMTIGARIALSRGIRHALQDPNMFEPDFIPVVPALLKYMLSMDALNKNLGTIIIGGTPCDESIFRALFKRGIRVMHGYGLTETSSGIAVSTDPKHIYAMRPCPGTTFRIARDGEIYLKTPNTMVGYYHDPEATAAKIDADGWLHTGDLGHIDEEGRLIVLGKKDEVLLLPNGEKVFCPEWEEELNRRIGSETAVYLDGEELKLAVVLRHRTREEIWDQVEEFNKKISNSRQIRAISLWARPFPRTAQGELQRWKIAADSGA